MNNKDINTFIETKEIHNKRFIDANDEAGNMIGCIITDFANPFYIPVIQAIEDLAEISHYSVILGQSRRQMEIEKRLIDRFSKAGIRGLIIRPVMTELDHLYGLQERGIPVVIAGRSIPEFDSVNENNHQAGYLAGKYLTTRGHRHIGYVYSGMNENIPEMERMTGFRESLNEKGLFIDRLYAVGGINIKNGEHAARQWLSEENRPSAVFCSTDLLAMGFVQQTIKMGKNVPEDVSVIGHDDIPFADSYVVGLTTIAFPKYALGNVAAKIIFERIHGKISSTEPHMVTLEPELVERSSCKTISKN